MSEDKNIYYIYNIPSYADYKMISSKFLSYPNFADLNLFKNILTGQPLGSASLIFNSNTDTDMLEFQLKNKTIGNTQLKIISEEKFIYMKKFCNVIVDNLDIGVNKEIALEMLPKNITYFTVAVMPSLFYKNRNRLSIMTESKDDADTLIKLLSESKQFKVDAILYNKNDIKELEFEIELKSDKKLSSFFTDLQKEIIFYTKKIFQNKTNKSKHILTLLVHSKESLAQLKEFLSRGESKSTLISF